MASELGHGLHRIRGLRHGRASWSCVRASARRLLAHGGTSPTGKCAGLVVPRSAAGFRGVPVENRQEIDKSGGSPIRCPAKLLPELVELMGIEPMTS